MGFSRAELETFRNAEVPDLIGPRVRLLFVGINPGLWTAATGTHFAHPGNRFYPALLAAGIVDRNISRSNGMTAEDRAYLIACGIGFTNLVRRATARADELSRSELREGAARLTEVVAANQPKVVAIGGITAYRTAYSRPGARLGEQPEPIAQAGVWVVPNPSGLNAHATIASLASAYAAAADAAGLVLTSGS